MRVAAKPLGIVRIDASADCINIQFAPNPPVEAAKIIALIQSGKEYSLAGPDRLRIQVNIPDVAERVKHARKLIERLQS